MFSPKHGGIRGGLRTGSAKAWSDDQVRTFQFTIHLIHFPVTVLLIIIFFFLLSSYSHLIFYSTALSKSFIDNFSPQGKASDGGAPPASQECRDLPRGFSSPHKVSIFWQDIHCQSATTFFFSDAWPSQVDSDPRAAYFRQAENGM